jgi:VCBS repeat-containing protein
VWVRYNDGANNSNTVNITITVTDVNDNRPVLAATSGVVSLAENLAGADTGIVFTVTDRDANNTFTSSSFTITGDQANKFEIVADGSNWKLKLKSGFFLNREELSAHNLQVKVNDGVQDSLVSGVRIVVRDVDEGDATFAIGSNGDINDPAVGSVLTASRTADDPDGNGTLSYRWYRIDSNGAKTDIAGTTGAGASYTVTEDDVDYRLGVRITYTDGGNNSESIETALTNAVPAQFGDPTSGTTGTADEDDPFLVDASGQLIYGTEDQAKIKASGGFAIKTQSAYGTATIDADTGAWTFNVDNTNTTINALDDGETATATIVVTVTLTDGTTVEQEIAVTINGRTDLAGGTAASDTITGTSAAEVIQGGNAADTISTGGGGDIVIGGYGDDIITLGAGADTVIYRFTSRDSGSWRADDGGDTINNFKIGEDKLVFVDTDGTTPITLADLLDKSKSGPGKGGVLLEPVLDEDFLVIIGINISFIFPSDDNGPTAPGGTETKVKTQILFDPSSHISGVFDADGNAQSAGVPYLGPDSDGDGLPDGYDALSLLLTDFTLLTAYFGEGGLEIITLADLQIDVI